MPSPLTRSSAPGPSPARPVVLIADDYPENRRLIYLYLRSEYDVEEAPSAEEALERLAAGGIDLVVMDLNFRDGMNGIAAVQEIRRNPATAKVPVLALTAYAYPHDRDRCVEAGFDDYLSKPVFKDAMLKKVAMLIASRRSGSGDGDNGLPDAVWITRGKRED